MSKLKKTQLIVELSKLGIEYDGMSYNDMYKLYKIAKKNDSLLNAAYMYIPGEGEELLIDRPSTPVQKLI